MVPLAQTPPARPKPAPPSYPRAGDGHGGGGYGSAEAAPAAAETRNLEEIRSILIEPVPPGQLIVPRRADPRARASQRLQRAIDHYENAAALGVNVASENWYTKLRGAGVALLSLIAAAALTATTGGAAAPILALASVTLAVAVGDAFCAYRSLKNAQARAEGQTPPYAELPMGDSSAANLAYFLLEKAGVSDPKFYAKHVGRVIKLGLALGGMAASFGLSLAGPTAIEFVNALASQLSTLHTFASTFRTDPQGDLERTKLELEESYRELALAAKELSKLAPIERAAIELRMMRHLRKAATCDPMSLVRDRHIAGRSPGRNILDQFFGLLAAAPSHVERTAAAAGAAASRARRTAGAALDAAAYGLADTAREGQAAIRSTMSTTQVHLDRSAGLVLHALRFAVTDVMTVVPSVGLQEVHGQG
jgi:hypothetical protein